MDNQTLIKDTFQDNQAMITEVSQALKNAGNPLVSIVVSFDDNKPVMEFVTENAITLGSQQAEVAAMHEEKAKASGNLDVDIEQTKVHLHADAKASDKVKDAVVAQVAQAPATPQEEVTLVPVTNPADLQITMNTETKEITLPLGVGQQQADGSIAIPQAFIRPDKITPQDIAGLQEMAQQGLFGANGQERLNAAMNEVYKLRPDLAPQQQTQEEHQIVQAQKSAREGEVAWRTRIVADQGARIHTGREL
jgi:hypothetical protein